MAGQTVVVLFLGLSLASAFEIRWASRHVKDDYRSAVAFSKAALFSDLETGKELYIDPELARAQYQANFQRHQGEIEKLCRELGIDFYQMATDTPLELSLSDFIRSRAHARRQVLRAGNRGAAG